MSPLPQNVTDALTRLDSAIHSHHARAIALPAGGLDSFDWGSLSKYLPLLIKILELVTANAAAKPADSKQA